MANDQFANLEVNYLLQRLERFNGLSILTTNLTKSIDATFRCRVAYDVQFAFPRSSYASSCGSACFPGRRTRSSSTAKIWRRGSSCRVGYIKVAAERAAFIAAGRQEPIKMATLIDTVERMYRERGKLSPVGKLE